MVECGLHCIYYQKVFDVDNSGTLVDLGKHENTLAERFLVFDMNLCLMC